MILSRPRLPILETGRLRLEPLAPADAGLIFPLMADSEVMAFWDSPETDDPDMVAEVVAGQIAAAAQGGAIHWTIRTLVDGAFVGVCGLSEIDRRRKRAEVDFMLGRENWGNGYAREAMAAVVGYAAASGLQRLLACIQLGDRRSDALLQKLGFREEGLLRGYVERDGERRDCRLLGLLL